MFLFAIFQKLCLNDESDFGVVSSVLG